MASFKAGDRVRKIAHHPLAGHNFIPLGTEGTIVSAGWPAKWNMAWDGHGELHPCGSHWGADDFQLAPLTDPAADAFLERMKKLGSEPVVLTPKQLAHG